MTTEKKLRLDSIVVLATKILGKSAVNDWLYCKIPSLNNEIPFNLLDTEIGYRLVEETLLKIQYGIYC